MFFLLSVTAVFASLENTRSNSMTSAGQCRLAPLIACIQDSCQLYDYCVKMLFKLHSSQCLSLSLCRSYNDKFMYMCVYLSCMCVDVRKWRCQLVTATSSVMSCL